MTTSKILTAVPVMTGGSCDGTAARRLTDVSIASRGADDGRQEPRSLVQESALQRATETLRALDAVPTVLGLIEAGAKAICELGFERGIVSRLHGSDWVMESAHDANDPSWRPEVMRSSQANTRPLAVGAPEREVLRRRKPILVTTSPLSFPSQRKVAEVQRSYVAAPITSSGQVIGFIHADRGPQNDDVTSFDRELLSVFAQAYSLAFERAVMVERMDQLRGTLRGLVGRLDDGVDLVDEPWRLNGAGRGAVRPIPDLLADKSPIASVRLTPREREVLEYMAKGDTNARIACRIVVSEDTVKTHVKHVLRKLGASNRAEAVARWHQANSASREA